LLPATLEAESLAGVRAARDPLVVFAVPDQHIAGVAMCFAQAEGISSGTSFVHLSGAHGLEALEPLAAGGHGIGCFHPLQPFPAVRGPEAFYGTFFAVNASSPALRARLDELARSIGGHSKPLADAWRPLYHAAAVMASTYVVVLAAQAGLMLQAVGWEPEESLLALLPLMRGALDNLATERLPGGLNGPMRRGDASTVANHVAAIAKATPPLEPDTLQIYQQLGSVALRLAVAAGLGEEQAAALVEALGPRTLDAERELSSS
jgi:predicted short-subunit dehydrogenase-like oxidoreductase (DUF2520 family)